MEREQIPPILPATCAMCGSTEIVYAESALSIVKPYVVRKPVSDAQQENGVKMNYLSMGMNVLVCTDCGHSTFYAKEPHKLKHKSQEMSS